MAYNYVVTAQRPTSVHRVLKGNFTGPDDVNLIVCRSTRLEVHLLTPDGLVAQLDLGIYGRISVARLYRPATETQDLLFVCTERRRFFVLAYDAERQQVVTRANGDVNEGIGKPVDNEQIGIVDPDCRVMGLHLYEGLFKVIPLDPRSGIAREAFKVRLEELQVLDIQFLHGYARPTLAVLYEDMKENRHIKTYEVLTKSKDLADGAWSQSNVDPGTEMLVAIPAPFRGVLVLGTESVAYVDGSKQGGSHVSIPTRCGIIRAAGQIDAHGMRWLLCDGFGGLHVLALQASQSPAASSSNTPETSSFGSDSTIVGMTMEYLGKTSIASSIAYLDNGVVFVGSSGGDSQLINLLTDKDSETDSYIQVLETYTNLGPIVDFCVMDLKRQGQCQIVTCSGALTDGSLRLVRNGIGIDEQASVDLPGIKGIWSLRKSFASKWDSFLVQSFVGETRVLAIEDEEMGEHEIAGFDADVQTLFCGNMSGDVLVQITSAQVRLVYANAVAHVWTPPATEKRITVAAGNAKQIFVALGGGHLVLLHVDSSDNANPKLVQKASVTMDQEIACLDATPLTPTKVAPTKDSADMEVEAESNSVELLSASLLAVGMWTDYSLRLLSTETLEELHKEPLGGDTIPRSLLFASFRCGHRLLCGLGDGHLFTFTVHTGAATDVSLLNRKKLLLATQPISLSSFRSGDNTHVFAASDRPTVIYCNGDKLLYSNVNLPDVSLMTPFNSESFPDCLALTSEEELKIGTINDIQKVHIRTIPLGEQPRRITHHAASSTVAVFTVRYGNDDLAAEVSANEDYAESCQLRLFDDQSFDLLDTFQLDEFEHGTSLIVCDFADETSEPAAGNDAAAASSTGSGALAAAAKPPTTPGANSTASAAQGGETTGDQSKTATLAGNSKQYIVLGTAYVLGDEVEPTKGRILVFEVVRSGVGGPAASGPAGSASGGGERKLSMVLEKATRGAPYTMDAFQGKLLAGINSKVQLFKFVSKDGYSELQTECGHHGHILALFIKSRGDFVVVGDLMKSISLLMYNSLGGSIEEIARDYNANWMLAVDILDDETFIGAENFANLFTVQKNSGATSDEERNRLEVVGEFHLGEYVNKFQAGSLVMRSQGEVSGESAGVSGTAGAGSSAGNSSMTIPLLDRQQVLYPTPFSDANMPDPQFLLATTSGAIGVIAPLNLSQFNFLLRVQAALNSVVQGIGGLEHTEWRSFHNVRKTVLSSGFIDGDLVESFLDLSKEDMSRVLTKFNADLNKSTQAAVSGQAVSTADGDEVMEPVDSKSMRPLTLDEMLKVVEELARLH